MIHCRGFDTTREIVTPQTKMITMASWLMKSLAKLERAHERMVKSMKKGGAWVIIW